MKKYIYSLALILALVSGVFAQPYDYCIYDVTLIRPELPIPMVRHQNVFIYRQKIVTIAPATTTPPTNCQHLIDGGHKYLMVGLTDMHVHLPSEGTEKFMLMNLLAGVTSIRSMRGKPSHIELKKDLASFKMIGPDLYIATPYFPNKNITIDHLADSIKAYKEAGYDLVKVLAVPDSLYFEALMKAANDIKMPVAGHAVWQVPIDRLVESGYGCLEHLQDVEDVYTKDANQFALLTAKIKEHNMFNCPTLDFYNVYWNQVPLTDLQKRAGMEYIDQKQIAQWTQSVNERESKYNAGSGDSVVQKAEKRRNYIQTKLKVIKALNDAGAKLLMSPASANDDFCPPGFCVWQEMKLFAEAGISNREILKIATYNAADYYNELGKWGRLGEGQKANLIILNKNPLESIDNIQSIDGVFHAGQYYSKERLENLVKQK
jgi:hypothetical protein